MLDLLEAVVLILLLLVIFMLFKLGRESMIDSREIDSNALQSMLYPGRRK